MRTFLIDVPDTNYEFEPEFWDKYIAALQLMVNRMAVGECKYHIGRNLPIAETHEDKIKFAQQRMYMYYGKNWLEACDCGYAENPSGSCHGSSCFLVVHKDKQDTGNTENLLDAGNGLLVEFVYPDHPKAHFRSQSSEESPGLAMRD